MAHEQQVGKGEVIRALLEREGRVMLCVDATCKGVEVPRRFASDTGLRLVLNAKMPQSIEIGPKAVESELRFGGIPHYCIIPYEALWGAFNPDSGQGMLWSEAMPEAVRRSYFATQGVADDKHGSAQINSLGHVKPMKELPTKNSEERHRFAVIEGRTEPDSDTSSDARKKSPARNHLRLVK
ncbi:MAG: hypothetical protein HQL64_12025 [Magnetococcales bacterium]|nr:hypothetical protein [Magnetococcales bacterium]